MLEIAHSWGLVDVNGAGDIPPALDAMAGAMLYAPVEPPPLRLEGRRVLLIGSGKDLVGRGLGECIDAGELDLVVRCNHFHGDPADVGTRTDIAVLRISKLEKSFMEEAPVASKRMIVHTSGEVIPLNFLFYFFYLRHLLGGMAGRVLIPGLLRILAAGTVLAAFCGGTALTLIGTEPTTWLGNSFILRFGELALGGILGGALYALACLLFRVPELQQLTARFLRRGPRA